ncbi:MarR family transcriptional regulator [Exilibacterium tricleocarpae]|uniref:MarR family transcriptional regulator n=1 Tax=Exilibacterium tricleocarpae TaxID=2591008 RepID=A0A545TVG9_9GAMM|nr:MarR family transcriptional regulator [Exilibacterium tricleocarpae]TQV81204.1 MarR family transcriptional regulator [Exilibacterium tricleocarpae]
MQSLEDPAADDTDNLYLKLWLQLAKSSKAMEQEMEARFQRNFKQSLSRFDVMSQLQRYDPQWLPMGKLAAQLIASKGNITRLIDRMIVEGLLSRRASPEDRRMIQVGLTDKGRALFHEMAAAHANWAGLLLGNLDREHGHQLLELLLTVNSALKAGIEETS